MKHHKIYSALIILFTLSVTLVVFNLGTSAISHVSEVRTKWSLYTTQAAENSYLLSQVHKHLGYGGFIHQFKNLVLRRDISDINSTIHELDQTITILNQYQSQVSLSVDEKAALGQLLDVLDEYRTKFFLAIDMIEQQASPTEIDAVVRVSDTPAHKALELLNRAAVIESARQRQLMNDSIDSALQQFRFTAIILPMVLVASILLVFLMFRSAASNEKAQKSVRFFNKLFEAMPDALLTVGDDGTIAKANGAMLSLTGYKHNELVGMELEQLLPEEFRSRHKGLRKGFFSSPKYRAITGLDGLALRTKNGSSVPVEISLSHLTSRDEVIAIAVVRDISVQLSTQNKIKQSQVQLSNAQKITKLGSWTLNASTLQMTWSDQVYSILEVDRDYYPNPDLHLYFSKSPKSEFHQFYAGLKSRSNKFTQYGFERTVAFKSGKSKVIKEVGEIERDAQGAILSITGTIQDITEQKEQFQAIKQSAIVFENISDAVVITDSNRKIVAVNKAFIKLTGYSEDECLGKDPGFTKSGRHSQAFYRDMNEALAQSGTWQGEIYDRRKNGDIFPKYLRITRAPIDKTDFCYIGIFSDITEKKKAEDRLKHQALHDSLTGLPNRAYLFEHLTRALKHADRLDKRLAVLFVDLDHFKRINDSLGHPAGDALLKVVASRLKESIYAEDVAARISGDEFVVVIEETPQPHAIENIAKRILSCFHTPTIIDGNELHVTASIGISIYPQDAENATELLKTADMALYRSKEMGRNGFHFYSREMDQQAMQRLSMEAALRNAIEAEHFELHYQPQFDLQTGDLLGCEALVRWVDPVKGVIPPNNFIPLAEDSKLIIPLGEWVIRTAVAQMSTWRKAGLLLPRVSVNLAGLQIVHGNICALTEQILNEYGLSPDLLEYEITETLVMNHLDKALPVLQQLRAQGVMLSIDDFGTGYSSLNYLKQLPIHKVKIDRSFIRDIPQNQDDVAITKAIVAMGNSLQLDVIAEGIETPEQSQFLVGLGCHMGQGYLYGKPVRAEEFTQQFGALPQTTQHSGCVSGEESVNHAG